MNSNDAAEAAVKPHLSPSSLDVLAKCPEKWRRRYLESEKGRPTFSMAVGSAVHTAMELMFIIQRDSGELIPATELVDAAQEMFAGEAKDGLVIEATAFEDGTVAEDHLNEAQSKIQRMVLFGREVFGKEYTQPKLVEHEFRLVMPGKYDLVGVIDLADERGIVVDFKTGTKAKPQSDADNNLALTLYAIAHRAIEQKPAVELRLETIIDAAKGPKSQMLRTYRDGDSMRVLARRLEAAEALIQGGSFPPAPTNAWWCSAKMCEYHSTCKYAMKPTSGDLVELAVPRESGTKMQDGVDSMLWLAESYSDGIAASRKSLLRQLLEQDATCHYCNRSLKASTATLSMIQETTVLACALCSLNRRLIPEATEE